MWTTTVQGEVAEEGEEAPMASVKMIRIVSEGNKYKAALVQVIEWNLIKFKLYTDEANHSLNTQITFYNSNVKIFFYLFSFC